MSNLDDASRVYFDYIKKGRNQTGALILASRDCVMMVNMLARAFSLLKIASEVFATTLKDTEKETVIEYKAKLCAWLEDFEKLRGEMK